MTSYNLYGIMSLYGDIMNLTEFLKYYKASSTNTFGMFIKNRRLELGYSLRHLASNLGISAVYLSDIETGARPAPLKLLGSFIRELQVSPSEKETFYELAELSHQNWPDIINFLTKTPNARKFLKLAIEHNLSDEVFAKLIKIVNKQTNCQENNEENQTTL